MSRAPLAIALSSVSWLAGCLQSFPGERESGVFGCENDSHCLNGYVCVQQLCVDPATLCPEPTLVASASPTGPVWVGAPIALDGEATGSEGCVVDPVAWYVCSAPAGSAFAPPTPGSCTLLASGADATLVPDRRGSYGLELRATAGGTTEGVESLTVSARSDTLFVELQFVDPDVLPALVLSELACDARAAQTTCATQPGCAWAADSEVCWVDCAVHGDETSCTSSGDCRWDTTCQPAVPPLVACIVRDASACESLAGCEYDADAGHCYADCSLLTDEQSCGDAFCGWYDAPAPYCGEPPYRGIPEPALAAITSDGAESRLLEITGENPVYRFDPNGMFAGGVRAGTGVAGGTVGAAFDSALEAAAFAHLYLYRQPDDLGATLCAPSQTLLLWRGTTQLGKPAANGVIPLTPIQRDSDVAGEPTTSYSVGFPDVTRTSGGELRVVFGLESEAGSPSDCAELAAADYEAAFVVLPLMSSAAASPLANRAGMPLQLAHVAESGPSVRPPRAIGTYPCHSTADCRGGTCQASGTCAGTIPVEGYLPKLRGAGRALTFSHVTCASGAGAACDIKSDGLDYDIVAATIQDIGTGGTITDFNLDEMQFWAADPAVQELDAIVQDDVFSTSPTPLFYLGYVLEPGTMTVLDGGVPSSVAVDVPVFSLFSRLVNWDSASSGWIVTPAAQLPATAVVSGTAVAEDLAAAEPCAVDGVAGRQRTSTYRLRYPMQLTVAPNGRYLAYADIESTLACHEPFSLGGTSPAMLVPGDALSSEIKVVNLALGTAPERPYPDACLPILGAVNVMPRFVADGTQLVFSSQGAGEGGVGNRFLRLNVADFGASDCRLTEVVSGETVAAALEQASPELVPVSVSIVDSRTHLGGCYGCSGSPAGLAALAATLLVFVLRRRRRR